jgi:hypothetical protein
LPAPMGPTMKMLPRVAIAISSTVKGGEYNEGGPGVAGAAWPTSVGRG